MNQFRKHTFLNFLFCRSNVTHHKYSEDQESGVIVYHSIYINLFIKFYFQVVVSCALLSVVRGGLIAGPHGAISSQGLVLGAPGIAHAGLGYGGLGYGGLGYGGLGYGGLGYGGAVAAPAIAGPGYGLGKIICVY